MIIDHRTYTLRPGTLAEYVRLYETIGYKIQSRHLGEPLGWYTSMDIGQLNQIVHLWRYDDLADRARRRAAMQGDAEWHGFLKQATPLIMTMENKILTSPPFIGKA
jgi:hypothetical protein